MKNFVEPEITVEDFVVEDILATSGGQDWGTGEGGL